MIKYPNIILIVYYTLILQIKNILLNIEYTTFDSLTININFGCLNSGNIPVRWALKAKHIALVL